LTAKLLQQILKSRLKHLLNEIYTTIIQHNSGSINDGGGGAALQMPTMGVFLRTSRVQIKYKKYYIGSLCRHVDMMSTATHSFSQPASLNSLFPIDFCVHGTKKGVYEGSSRENS